eukprot:12443108-Alexandrium_andersonii.AAC.1
MATCDRVVWHTPSAQSAPKELRQGSRGCFPRSSGLRRSGRRRQPGRRTIRGNGCADLLWACGDET